MRSEEHGEGAADLAAVAEGCKEILARTEFTVGNRYADFDPSIDKVAAYGVGALIAGKVLAKAGFLKVLAGLTKPLLIGLAVVGGLLFKLLGGRRKKAEPTAEAGGA